MTALAFLVPGRLEQLTGGYIYDRKVVEGLRARGWTVSVAELAGRFPEADASARTSAAAALAGLPTGALAVVDGLALPGFADCLPAQSRRLRLVGLIHHPLAAETGLSPDLVRHYAALEARLWPQLHGLVCASAHTARQVVACGIAAQRVAVVSPGTDKPAGAAAPRDAGALRLLAVGTVTPRKGHLLLVAALSGLRDFDWRLTCIGSLERDPAAVAALRRAIEASGLGDRIALLGEQPPAQLDEAFRRADLFALPSYHEGYGMAFAEALAHGLPVIATTAGAIPDTVPPEASLLVPPGDARALEGALRRVFTDASLRASLAAGAARSATALPDWPQVVDRWIDVLDRFAA